MISRDCVRHWRGDDASAGTGDAAPRSLRPAWLKPFVTDDFCAGGDPPSTADTTANNINGGDPAPATGTTAAGGPTDGGESATPRQVRQDGFFVRPAPLCPRAPDAGHRQATVRNGDGCLCQGQQNWAGSTWRLDERGQDRAGQRLLACANA